MIVRPGVLVGRPRFRGRPVRRLREARRSGSCRLRPAESAELRRHSPSTRLRLAGSHSAAPLDVPRIPCLSAEFS